MATKSIKDRVHGELLEEGLGRNTEREDFDRRFWLVRSLVASTRGRVAKLVNGQRFVYEVRDSWFYRKEKGVE